MDAKPGKIFAALAAVMAEVDAIGKNKKNEQQHFRYRGIDDVYNAIHPLMAKHGVLCVPQVIESRREERTSSNNKALMHTISRVRYAFFAVDGSSVEAVVDGEGMDSGDKSTSKSLAMAHKYCLFQLLMIPTEDLVDGDAESPEAKPRGSSRNVAQGGGVLSDEQKQELLDMIVQSTDELLLDKVLKMVGAENLDDVLATMYEPLKRKLKKTLEAERANR